MSRELIERLASSGMNMKQAAASIGMKFHLFRDLREMYMDIPWQPSDRQRQAPSERCKLSWEQKAAIIADPRNTREIADDYGINRSYVSRLKIDARNLSALNQTWE